MRKPEYSAERRTHWDGIAERMGTEATWGEFYHQTLAGIYRRLVLPGQKVLEIGCSRGDLLASLKPSLGVGIDLSRKMVEMARTAHPDLIFLQADAHEICFKERFDVIILSDLVNDLWDVQRAFQELSAVSGPHTRIIMNSYSRLWEYPLAATENLNLAMPLLRQSWLTADDLDNLLRLTGCEVVRHWSEIVCPVDIPFLASLLNRFVGRIWPFNHLSLTNFIVARPVHGADRLDQKPVVSVIVPARNEEGNVPEIVRRIPEMGGGTEIVFVEGHSSDSTYEAIQREMASRPDRRCKLFRQTGEGKGDAVRMGFEQADGDILMILDADLTVPPEDLPRFYDALATGKGEFINGVRLVYPMEHQAMRFLNLVGNKLFSLAFSWLLGQTLKDTLCGTKVMWREQYELIAAHRSYFGYLDPFGDFDLILGAARLNLKIIDMPIRYRERTYGTTNIRRWQHGVLLFRMLFAAASRIKFV
ncbi:MAG: bifunctional class I SAM-dependent methyltransferase/glycosyltransferase family 2 protein [Pseudomonadota bacterium]